MNNQARSRGSSLWLIRGIEVLVIASVSIAGLGSNVVRAEGGAKPGLEFHDVRQHTRQFHAYNRSIELTGEQRAVMHEALSSVRAPCCADRTAATCCCPCNMAKAWWGLSKYLIVEHGYGADQVRQAVIDWIRFINPDGFTGDACYTGGCDRPFHENGCGGMRENKVVF
jgi:hypothetical protein